VAASMCMHVKSFDAPFLEIASAAAGGRGQPTPTGEMIQRYASPRTEHVHAIPSSGWACMMSHNRDESDPNSWMSDDQCVLFSIEILHKSIYANRFDYTVTVMRYAQQIMWTRAVYVR
jgi:hypothetical protein